jgi:hypothetical protein
MTRQQPSMEISLANSLAARTRAMEASAHEYLGRRSPPWLILEIDIGERLAVVDRAPQSRRLALRQTTAARSNDIYRYTLVQHVRLDIRLEAIFCKTVELFAKLNAPRQLKPTLL